MKLKFSNNEITSCSFSSNGNLLTGGSADGKIFFFEKKNMIKPKMVVKIHNSLINKIVFDSHCLYTSSSDKSCKILEINTLKIVRTLNLNSGKSIDFDIFGDYIITAGDNGNLKIWDKRIIYPIFNFSFGFYLKLARFFQDSLSFLTLGISSEILFGDLKKFTKNISIKISPKKISSLCILQNSSLFYSLNEFGQISKWSLNLKKKFLNYCFFPSKKISFEDNEFINNKIVCDFQGDFIMHGSSKGFIYIYDLKKKNLIKVKKNHYKNVYDMNFHPKNNFYCSCGEDGNLILDDF
jgi:WD40 repeat protein